MLCMTNSKPLEASCKFGKCSTWRYFFLRVKKPTLFAWRHVLMPPGLSTCDRITQAGCLYRVWSQLQRREESTKTKQQEVVQRESLLAELFHVQISSFTVLESCTAQSPQACRSSGLWPLESSSRPFPPQCDSLIFIWIQFAWSASLSAHILQ